MTYPFAISLFVFITFLCLAWWFIPAPIATAITIGVIMIILWWWQSLISPLRNLSTALVRQTTIRGNWQYTDLQTIIHKFNQLQELTNNLQSHVDRHSLQLDFLMQGIPGIAFLLDRDRRFLLANSQLIHLLGAEPDSIYRRDMNILPPELKRPLTNFLDSNLTFLSKEIELEQKTFLLTLNRDQNFSMVVGVDITPLKQAEAKWRHQTSRDALTGLANRMQFNADLAVVLERAEQTKDLLAILFFDLDRFRLVNDSLGHIIGDLLLQSVADVLKQTIVKLHPEGLIARWGGDEFTILLPRLHSKQQATQIAQALLIALDQDFMVGGYTLHTTASIGIAVYPLDGEDNESLIKNADAALHFAKARGRNNWQVYDQNMNNRSHEVLILENGLHRAIAQEEFMVYYQPKVDAGTGRVTGLEALIRWQNPDLGLVMPGDFVPLAEENGLVVPIGEWVLQEVCWQNRQWANQGLAMLPIAVNLSARQFLQPNLLAMVERSLQQFGIPPQFLEIEITESLAMNDMEMTRSILKRFYQMGIGVTIDDFGTGYSSLYSLKHFPLHTLKIDRSFIKDIVHDHQDRAIVQAIISLGQGLKLKVIAEGVETQEQWEILRNLRCSELQGYLFSHPLPASRVTSLLSANDQGLILVPKSPVQ
jgi:diguanylate cyclase (GGDEF)-like protein